MGISEISKVTEYSDINEVLYSLAQGVVKIFDKNLVGLYLSGSLSYGDFELERSDIDLLTILNKPASQEQIELLKKMHLQVEKNNPKWAKRIECSYIPIDMLQNTLPPQSPRPYVGEGIFYPKALYGNEWLINKYLLYKHGVTLIGPDFKKLVKHLDIKDVKEACVRDLFKEWQPKITHPTYLKNSHYQSYVILNLCRILYTMKCNDAASKSVSASWVKKEYGSRWKRLIEKAENWKYGTEMNSLDETKEFIKFVISEVKR
ncbi:DUF4111 domain-containing protein [Candidatus Woesebacteria bacterium]|nr:DUF4111 domain-containing protein [Candidatus Woesebacteria bacterium]